MTRWLHHAADTLAAWIIAVVWRRTDWTIKGDDR